MSFKFADIICDTGEKITRLRITIGGFGGAVAPKSFKSAVIICDTGEKITRLRKTIGGFVAGRSPLGWEVGFDGA
ncbi:MAG TPA: hypothetical protein DDX72_10985 [Ruminococcaceae bacterium]|nr:hypothetical protein [Oscillospiraceae bacterium]